MTRCSGCASARCTGSPGEDLHSDGLDPEKRAYCESCWAEPADVDEQRGVSLASSVGIPRSIVAQIHNAFPHTCPLLYPDIELFEANSDKTRLGSVCLAIVDSQRVHSEAGYTVSAFFENHRTDLPIGPFSRLEQAECSSNGSNVAYQLTSGTTSWVLAFPNEVVAATFVRDFRVRGRVMKLELKASRLKSENEELKKGASRCSPLTWTMFFMSPIIVVGLALFVDLLLEDDPGMWAYGSFQ
mmetsp:Transcript_13780/g.37729  ORF Transcript_13780/g.37729 Transcript_13780/m.37729 type:complete len:242 (-) Transcript_13780:24-749(-)